MLGLLQLLLIGLIVALAIATLTMMHRLRHPPRKTYAWAVSRQRPGTPMELDKARPFDDITIKVGTLELSAWNIPGDKPHGPAIIFTPGWGDSRLGVLSRLAPLLPRFSRIIAWDPPGSGDTPGTCGLGVEEVPLLRGIIDRLREEDSSLAARGFVLFGSSLGAGVSIVAATEAHPLGVIAEAPYRLPWTPAANVMRLNALPHRINGPLAFACMGLRHGNPTWRGFDRAEHAAKLKCPLLVLHGENDEVCPIEDGRAIAAAAGSHATLITLPNGRHNDLWLEQPTREACEAAVSAFLASLAAAPGR